MLETKSECGRSRTVAGGGGATTFDSSATVALPKRHEVQRIASMPGRRAVPVTNSANRANALTLATSRSLTTTLRAHHALATLSSNRPRANGKMRWMACWIPSGKEG